MNKKLHTALHDIEHLKTFIKPTRMEFSLEDPMKDFRRLARLYKLTIIDGFFLFFSPLNANGAYNDTLKQIAVTPFLLQLDKTLTEIDLARVFSHELSHHLQYLSAKEAGFSGNTVNKAIHPFEASLEFEQACERLSYYTYNTYFTNYPQHHASFVGYKSKEDKKFLKEFVKQ